MDISQPTVEGQINQEDIDGKKRLYRAPALDGSLSVNIIRNSKRANLEEWRG